VESVTMMRRVLLVIALFATACGSDKPTGSADAVLAGWTEAGLEPASFTDGKSLAGGKCRQGSVSAMETILCEFPDENAAKKAEADGLAFVGSDMNAGVSLAQGKLLLVVADRKSTDPNGKRLNQIAKTFRARAGGK
jgi:hypothetical protein